MIPVIGFCTLKRFDLADALVKSIDYPVEHLVIVDNSGTGSYAPPENDFVRNVWVLPMPFGLGLTGAWNLIVKATPYAPYWILVNDDAEFDKGALAVIAKEADPGTISFTNINTLWSCIILGEEVVKKVGLYDERFYPLYFDDNDYDRRIREAGFEAKIIRANVHHQNSSTLNSGFQKENDRTFLMNHKLYFKKIEEEDFSEGNWDLQMRRDKRWD